MKNFCLYSILLLISTSITFTNGSNVSLVVQGGISLVTPNCPVNVTLFCEGIELASIRWKYNVDMDIISYFSDRKTKSQPDSLALYIVELSAFKQSERNPTLANFNSTLLVSISQLLANNISEISCGTPGITRSLPVNVSIIGPSAPNVPRLVTVTAAYQSEQLNSIEVEWSKPDNYCPSYNLTLDYEVSITGHEPVRTTQSSCGESLCMARFNELMGGAEPLVVSIKARNKLGSSDVIRYPPLIARQVQEYFIPEAYLKNGQLFGQCRGAGGTIQPTECNIQYTLDSMYRNLSNPVVTSLDREVLLLDFVTSRTYYLQFSVLIDSFEVTDRASKDFSAPDGSLPDWGIAVIIIVIFGLIVTIVILLLCLYKVKHKRYQDKETIPEVKYSDSKIGYKVVVKPIFKTSDEGKQKYPEYMVTVKYKSKTSSVLKCYSDFENLQKEVKDCVLGSLVLPSKKLILPDKQKEFDPEDIGKQQRGLLNVLNTILKTPDILKSHHSAIKLFFGPAYEILHEAITGTPDFEEIETRL